MKTSFITLRHWPLLFGFFCAIQTSSAFYNPETGRWLSRDPINETGGANLYGWVRNDPDEVDVLGLECFCCCADSVKIEDVKNYDDNPRFGHAFNVKIKMSFPDCKEKEAEGLCTLRWWEKSNRMYGGLDNDKWHLMSDILKGKSTTVEPWEKRKPKQTEAVMNDTPFANVSAGGERRLLGYILVESEKGCDCKNRIVFTTYYQVIDGDARRGVKIRRIEIDKFPPPEWKTLPEPLPPKPK